MSKKVLIFWFMIIVFGGSDLFCVGTNLMPQNSFSDESDIFFVDTSLLWGGVIFASIVGGVLGYFVTAPEKEDPQKKDGLLDMNQVFEMAIEQLNLQMTLASQSPAPSLNQDKVKDQEKKGGGWLKRCFGVLVGAGIFGGGSYWFLSQKTPSGRLAALEKQLDRLYGHPLIVNLNREDGALDRVVMNGEKKVVRCDDLVLTSGRRILFRAYGLIPKWREAMSDAEEIRKTFVQYNHLLDMIADRSQGLQDDVKRLKDDMENVLDRLDEFGDFILDDPAYKKSQVPKLKIVRRKQSSQEKVSSPLADGVEKAKEFWRSIAERTGVKKELSLLVGNKKLSLSFIKE